MRVHGEKVIRRRPGVTGLTDYRNARDSLREDFQNICGYCGKNCDTMHERFHIDHFVPRKIDPDRENDYYNLVFACPKCNMVKSSKWPTGDKNVPHDDVRGFVDPASEEYDQHIERDTDGYIRGKTALGKNMCKSLNFHIRRTDLYWKINHLNEIQRELRVLYKKGVLKEADKDYYIKNSEMLQEYIDEAFREGE